MSATADSRAAYMRRYRAEHREHLLEQQRERYHALYGGKRREPDAATDGLTASQRYWKRHGDEVNARKRAARKAEAVKTGHAGKNCVQTFPGRVCTDCRWYLKARLCMEDFFAAVSCGIRIAETCVNYELPERPCRKKITAPAPEPEPAADAVPEAAETVPEQEQKQETEIQTEQNEQDMETQETLETQDAKERPVPESKTPEAQTAYYKEYYAKNKEKILARQHERYHADIDGMRARKREARARLRNEIARLREELEKAGQHTAPDEEMPSAAPQCPGTAGCPGYLLTPAVADSIRGALETMRACGIAPELRTVEGGVEIVMRLPGDPAGGAA